MNGNLPGGHIGKINDARRCSACFLYPIDQSLFWRAVSENEEKMKQSKDRGKNNKIKNKFRNKNKYSTGGRPQSLTAKQDYRM